MISQRHSARLLPLARDWNSQLPVYSLCAIQCLRRRRTHGLEDRAATGTPRESACLVECSTTLVCCLENPAALCSLRNSTLVTRAGEHSLLI